MSAWGCYENVSANIGSIVVLRLHRWNGTAPDVWLLVHSH